MGVLRGFGYFMSILILIAGILLLPVGIIFIIPAIIWMWYLHKGGQVTRIQKDLAHIRKMQQFWAEKALDDKIREEREKRNFNIKQGWE